ncbi:hypothetical protein V1477_003468 [Vespula maculifrons]|uniref:Uncharacterized protein n=1 Tax=Vespula maculifrons TaxID=7453 RepID=A0ABD2CST2_VESMC
MNSLINKKMNILCMGCSTTLVEQANFFECKIALQTQFAYNPLKELLHICVTHILQDYIVKRHVFILICIKKKFHNLNLIDVDIWITDNGTQVMTILLIIYLSSRLQYTNGIIWNKWNNFANSYFKKCGNIILHYLIIDVGKILQYRRTLSGQIIKCNQCIDFRFYNIIDVQNTAEPAQIKSVGLECTSLNIINHFCTILN